MSDTLQLHGLACQVPLPMEFSRQEYWSGLSFPSPGGLPHPGMQRRNPALQADSLPSEPPGKPHLLGNTRLKKWVYSLAGNKQTSPTHTKQRRPGIQKTPTLCRLYASSDGHTLSDSPGVTSQPGSEPSDNLCRRAQLEPLLTGSWATGMLDKKEKVRYHFSWPFSWDAVFSKSHSAPLLIPNFPHFNVS